MTFARKKTIAVPDERDLPLIRLQACPKGYTTDSDKTIAPADTVARVLERLESLGSDILRETRRVDVGRLGIPVYLSVCGQDARRILPTRKQMGKGASADQARASALMELMERYAFFSFWERRPCFVQATFSEARSLFGEGCLPLEEINRSVHDDLNAQDTLRVMDCIHWNFYPATRLSDGKRVWLPLDWFRTLSEFNGSSCGNSTEESLLQGICELVERHVCCLVDRDHRQTPTIDPESCTDPVLKSLLERFAAQGIQLILKDFSSGMPLPTVAALAWDPSTYPESSEIVFTAGTASSPVKAAIRAVTEVAQLGGDFCTNACYEASGLPKFASLDECDWVLAGDTVPLSSLPSIEHADIAEEVRAAVQSLAPLNVYAVETTNPDVQVPAHYLIIPGLSFRERDRNESIGLFAGRIVSETQEVPEARHNLEIIATAYPVAHFLPFFAGMLAMREERWLESADLFSQSIDRQPDDMAKGLASFYAGYALSMYGDWQGAEHFFARAVELCPDMKEYTNYLGVARFRQNRYEEAAEAFRASLATDKGSVMDLANLGMCKWRLGRLKEAREHLLAALELDPTLGFAQDALRSIEAELAAGTSADEGADTDEDRDEQENSAVPAP